MCPSRHWRGIISVSGFKAALVSSFLSELEASCCPPVVLCLKWSRAKAAAGCLDARWVWLFVSCCLLWVCDGLAWVLLWLLLMEVHHHFACYMLRTSGAPPVDLCVMELHSSPTMYWAHVFAWLKMFSHEILNKNDWSGCYWWLQMKSSLFINPSLDRWGNFNQSQAI